MQTIKQTGKITDILEPYSKGNFNKQEFVIDTGGEYGLVGFELIQEDMAQINTLAVGDTVEVQFQPRTRKWNDRYFTTLRCKYVQPLGSDLPEVPNKRSETSLTPRPEGTDIKKPNFDQDDVPF